MSIRSYSRRLVHAMGGIRHAGHIMYINRKRLVLSLCMLGASCQSLHIGILGPTVGFLLLLVFGALLVLFTVWLLLQYRLRVRSFLVTDFVAALGHSWQTHGKWKEYCLVLRPFGADGFLYFDGLQASGLKWLIFPWVRSVTAEQLVAKTAAKKLQSKVVALAAPEEHILPPGPKPYLVASSDWRVDVEMLIRHALIIIVILPPGKRVTPSVRWEVERCIRLGLIDRLIFILPPYYMPDACSAHDSFHDLEGLLPYAGDVPLNTVLVSPDSYSWFNYFHIDEEMGPSVAANSIEASLLSVFDDLEEQLREVTWQRRYPHAWAHQRREHRSTTLQ